MPRAKSTTRKTSLYRLTKASTTEVRDLIQKKYLDQPTFHSEEVKVGSKDCFLCYGTIETDEPAWVEHAVSLTAANVNLDNRTSAGVLVMPHDKEYYYALSFGMGHLIIDPQYIDSGFGLRFAIRRADPEQVQSITTHTLDTLPRSARTSVMGGARLDSFGMEEVGEVVSRLVGKVSATGLSCYNSPKPLPTGTKAKTRRASKRQQTKPVSQSAVQTVTIRGADALGIPLSKNATEIANDIDYIHNTVENEPPVAGLEYLENTHPLRRGNPMIEILNRELAEKLVPGTARLALCWPAEREDEPAEAHNYNISGAGREWSGNVAELDIEAILAPLAARPVDARVKALRTVKIMALSEDGEPLSRAISADKWLTFETQDDKDRYVFYRGQWYDVGSAYVSMLREHVEKILGNVSSLSYPPWPYATKIKKNSGASYLAPVDEGDYNIHASSSGSNLLCLDKQLVKTKQHYRGRGIEICDLLGPNNELIHVKRLDDSVSASHLFNQAIVSAEALRRDIEAVRVFNERVEEVSKGSRHIDISFRPHTVVIAFGGKKATVDDLFTFSQVTLSRCAQRLRDFDIKLEVASIADLPIP